MFNFFKKRGSADSVASEQEQIDLTEHPYAATQVGRVRHEVEYNFIHKYFYANPTGFIDSITDEHGFVIMYCTALKEHKLRKIPYRNDDFGLDLKKMDSGDYLIIVELPAPEFEQLNYRMYFLFSPDFKRIAYYTVERVADGAELCLWDKEHNRIVVGPIETARWSEKTKEERDAELAMVADSFAEVAAGERDLGEPAEPACPGGPGKPGEPEEPGEVAEEAQDAPEQEPESSENPQTP